MIAEVSREVETSLRDVGAVEDSRYGSVDYFVQFGFVQGLVETFGEGGQTVAWGARVRRWVRVDFVSEILQESDCVESGAVERVLVVYHGLLRAHIGCEAEGRKKREN